MSFFQFSLILFALMMMLFFAFSSWKIIQNTIANTAINTNKYIIFTIISIIGLSLLFVFLPSVPSQLLFGNVFFKHIYPMMISGLLGLSILFFLAKPILKRTQLSRLSNLDLLFFILFYSWAIILFFLNFVICFVGLKLGFFTAPVYAPHAMLEL